MAAVISLGLHTPSALPYLIAESLLPKDPSPELYTWNTYRDGGIEEEILFTAKCVVWSQGRTIKKAFSFEIEEEDVQHAVLAWFPSHEDPELLQSRSDVPFGQDGPGPKRARAAVKRHGDRTESCRALAVFLQYQAHVFFLSGASHIVKLPFEVDKVFPAARGIVLQRKVSGEASHRPETKKDLVVPQNSFQFSASQRSFDNRFNSSSQDLCSGLDFDLLQTQNAPRDDTMPRHYSFTSPLSELSLVVRIPQANFDFRSSFSKSLASLETLDTAEEILYVSPRDELPASEPNTAPLLLVVTANYEKGSYSVWQASYMESNPLAKAMAGQSTPTAASKLRRRSSFPTTGTATPIARGNRDSLGLARIRAAGETKKPPKSRRKGSKSTKEAEDALASQVDPEFEPRHTARESRRMSSMLSRADLNPSFDRSAFQDLASHHTAGNSFASHGRRGQSLGAGSERLSFGGSQRRLRASTPGTFSRLSIEDISDLAAARHLSGSQVSMTEEIDSFADLVGGQENPDDFDLHYPLGGLKKELLLRKFAEIPIDARTDHLRPSSRDNMNTDSNSARGARVFTIASPCTIEETNAHGRRFYLYIHNPLKRDCIHIEYSVGIRKVTTDDGSQGNDKPRTVPNPSFRSSIRLPEVIDVLQLIDGEQSKMALLKNSRSGQTALQLFSPWCAEGSIKVPLPRLRMFNPFDVDTAPKTRSVGKGTMPVPKTLNRLCHGGPGGLFDVVSDDQHHQIQLLLSPRSNWVSNIMEACLFVLPLSLGEKLFMIWWNRNQTYHSILQSEWHALAVTLLSFALACEGEKLNRRTVRRPLDTQSNLLTDREKQMLKIETSWNGSSNVGPAWSWAFDPSIPRLDDATDERIDQSKGKDPSSPSKSKDPFARGHVSAAREYLKYDGHDMYELLRSQRKAAAQFIPRIVLVLHLVREEMKLSCNSSASAGDTILAPVIAQLGRWLDWPDWDWKDGRYYNLELAGVPYDFEDVTVFHEVEPPAHLEAPPSVMAWLENSIGASKTHNFATVKEFLHSKVGQNMKSQAANLTPRLSAINQFFDLTHGKNSTAEGQVEAMVQSGITMRMLNTFPEALLAILSEPIVQCQAEPPTSWSSTLLQYISREDLDLRLRTKHLPSTEATAKPNSSEGPRDLHVIAQSTEHIDQVISFPNTERISVSRLIFNQDRRFSEAVHMIEPYRIAVAECIPEPQWTEAQILDAQREVHQWVMTRTFSLAPGLAFAHYDSRVPLLSEKFSIHGYNTLCVMKPLNNTVSVDRTTFTEERYAWAWFHSGVAAGLSISKDADGIDSSWIVFNRPSELNNRHAGLLLALGLNGHLKSMAKWLSFKYLTPKHTMTSIGLLVGLSASYLGTMDTLVTRLLSVHITRMLPPGAAELNLSPLTQTAGLMGIGLLYYNTQHRRMSEVMLSEIESMEPEDTSTGSEPIRDESYRLAGGFALGFINLGKGADLKGLHDLKIVERLLSIAVGPRRVSMVHMIDQATAGATIAIMLIFMKTGNKSIAGKIDIPETTAQFDFVRPDILLLRTVAKHLILWNDIRPDHRWIIKSLPKGFTNDFSLRDIESLSSEHMPFYNVLAGLLWSVGLRFAGSGNPKIRDFLIAYLDQFIRICRLPALRYDSRLTRNTARNCQDIVALSAATVMAGTGDLDVFRRLRSLHGRVNLDTTYGSHMACHMALGALFFGGGCYSLGTSNLAIASMIAAFYPVFPTDITDNKAHLQAFRHFWVLAAEARCIIPRDMDTNRTISLELAVQLRNGNLERITAPKLLPSLDSVARISTIGPEYWPVVLDFAGNPTHLEAFKRNQTLNVRHRPAHEAHTSVFTATLLTLNESRSGSKKDWLFRLPAFRQYEMTDFGPFLDGEEHGSTLDLRGSALDDWLLLATTASHGWSRDRLWNLKILFKWAERGSLDGATSFKWIRKEMLDKWKSVIEERARQLAIE